MPSNNPQPKHFRILHQLKSRLRIFSPALTQDTERAYIFAIILKKRPEIKTVKVVPEIGSVTIYFDNNKLPKTNLIIILDTILGNIGQKKLNLGQQQSNSADPTAPERDMSLSIEGMTCASCALLLELSLRKDPRISKASVNFASEIATITGRLTRKDFANIISSLGYKPNTMDTLAQRQLIIEKEQQRLQSAKKRVIWASLLSLPVVAIGMAMPRSRYLHWLQFFLSTPVILGAGRPFFDKAWKLAKQGTANMDSLIAIGVGSAYGYSIPVLIRNGRHLYFEAAAAIISFVLLGRYMEEKARGKAGEAIRKLIDLQPQKATLLKNGKEYILDIDEIKPGDMLLVRPGEKIPTDGEVAEGLSSIDEAMLTGESIPVIKETGQKVFAGCVNGTGSLTIRATAVGLDTVLANIVHMVDQAQSTKLPVQKLVDRVSAIFVPSVMVFSALTFTFWTISGARFTTAFSNAISVLLIACPCALGLATPMAIMVGAGQSARRGVYIRNGESLELANHLTTIIFDKTGTITEGKPEVTDFFNVSNYSDELVIKLCASAENNSEHFLAKAIINYAKHSTNYKPKQVSQFSVTPGKGLIAKINHYRLLIGNKIWMEEQDIDIYLLTDTAYKLGDSGKTPVFVAINGKAAALFGIADSPRKQAKSALQALDQLHIQSLMVTGDTKETAEFIAKQVGISTIIAHATPEQKLATIHHLQDQGEKVGMIGDGINDAPALAAADVGFAIGHGTDIAIESADITLVNGDISKVAETIELSSLTMRIIKQNLFWAFGYNTIALPVAAAGKLNPMIASLAMALSSVSVIINSLRITSNKYLYHDN